RTVEEDACAVDSTGSSLPVLDLADPALEALLAVLPLFVGQSFRVLLDSLLVRLLGVERAMRAATVVGAIRHDSLAAATKNARPRRRQPGEVDAENLLLVVGIDELNPLTRKVERDLWHARHSRTSDVSQTVKRASRTRARGEGRLVERVCLPRVDRD